MVLPFPNPEWGTILSTRISNQNHSKLAYSIWFWLLYLLYHGEKISFFLFLVILLQIFITCTRVCACLVVQTSSSGTFQHLCPNGGRDNVPQRPDSVLLLQYVTRGPRSKPHVFGRSKTHNFALTFCQNHLPPTSGEDNFSKKSPTGPTERTPKPEWSVSNSPSNLFRGSVGEVPFNF